MNVWVNRKKRLSFILFAFLSLSSFVSYQGRLSPPSPPGQPMVIDIWTNHCDLSYRAPLKDGGVPVRLYYIEKYLENAEDWTLAGTSPTLNYTVTNLQMNKRYKFRVKAENAVGMSEPSQETDYITIRDPYR